MANQETPTEMEEGNAEDMLEEIVGGIPQEGDDFSVEEEPEMEEESMEEAQIPDEEVMMDLYSSVYGEAMDDSDIAQEQLQELQLLLQAMPELSTALATNEISPSEAAIMIFREAAEVG